MYYNNTKVANWNSILCKIIKLIAKFHHMIMHVEGEFLEILSSPHGTAQGIKCLAKHLIEQELDNSSFDNILALPTVGQELLKLFLT